MLDITIERLSSESGMAPLVILQIESGEGASTIGGDLETLQKALERMGVTFLRSGEAGSGGDGIRLASVHVEEGMRPDELTAANDD